MLKYHGSGGVVSGALIYFVVCHFNMYRWFCLFCPDFLTRRRLATVFQGVGCKRSVGGFCVCDQGGNEKKNTTPHSLLKKVWIQKEEKWGVICMPGAS